VWSQRLVVIAVLGLIAVILVNGPRASTHQAFGSESPPQSDLVLYCAAGDMTMSIQVRRPSHRQPLNSGAWDAVHSHHRVATIVLRNVSTGPCLGGSAFSLTIRDHTGTMIGQWTNPGTWFTAYYQPGEYKTFSLPAVWHCHHRGPFTAIATVGSYTAHRTGLRGSEITCS
jgi:hypothetical protein